MSGKGLVWKTSQSKTTTNKNILKIIHLTNMYPLTNASCETGFSLLKKINSDWRSRLTIASLDQQMRICLVGPDVKDFDPKPPLKRWWEEGQRTKRPDEMPYGPRQ